MPQGPQLVAENPEGRPANPVISGAPAPNRHTRAEALYE